MRCDENEKIIKDALNTITTPQYDFRDEVRSKIIDKPQIRLPKKKINIILVTAIIIILSTTVLASTIPSFNRLFSMISPEMALILQPIDEENKNTPKIQEVGIKIKPLAVTNDDDMIIIYLMIQDLVGDRIDETLSIQEYFIGETTISNCQVIDYNKESKTAILKMTANGGKKLINKPIEIRINSILSRMKVFEELPINVNLSEIMSLSNTGTTKMSRDDTQGGGGSGTMWDELEKNRYIDILKPNKMEIRIPEIEVMHISNIGFIDGRLHIQTRWEENNNDSHGYFYLVDQDGNRMEIKENNFYFGVDEKNNIQFGNDYVEYILDVSKEQVGDVQLRGYFAEYGEVIEGQWDLQIAPNLATEVVKIPCDIQKETWQIKEVSLSPLGVTLRGEGGKPNIEQMKCSIKMKSGEVKGFDSVHTSNQMGEIVIKFGTDIPVNVGEIESIQIDEDVIKLN